MALVLRGLIELRFWADFISENSENAERFLNEANIDSKDLYERLLMAFPHETTLVANLPGGKRVHPTRIDDQEELSWKVCTKFVHPTSFVLDSPATTILNDGYLQLFAIKIVFYGWGILEMFHQINWTS